LKENLEIDQEKVNEKNVNVMDDILETQDDFNFWTPVKIEKGESRVNKEGKEEEAMYISGVASTSDRDLDGDILLPNGFDLSYFLKNGFINWQHGTGPSHYIGEPISGKVANNKFFVKAKLWSFSDLAKGVYGLMNNLKKSGANRKVGWSIEGKVIERDPINKKLVKKAIITNVALTPMPKNRQTFADIVQKGFTGGKIANDFNNNVNFNTQYICEFKKGQDTYQVDGNYNIFMNGNHIDKDMTTTSARAVMPEDVEGKMSNLTDSKEFGMELEKSLIMIYKGYEANMISKDQFEQVNKSLKLMIASMM